MNRCLDNNIEQPPFPRLGVHVLVITPFDAKHDLECMADRYVGAFVPVCEVNLAAFGRESKFMGERPRAGAHKRRKGLILS